MSASKNPSSVAEQGEFHSKVPSTAPMETGGHKPGIKVGNDAAPEFSAETYPPGTAPREDTYRPNPISEAPGQALNDTMSSETRTAASETLPGSTSQDVYTGYGKPVEGQSSQEVHGLHKRDRQGLAGVAGSTGAKDYVGERTQGYDLPEGASRGTRGKTGNVENWPAAEERLPVKAEEVASERR